MPVHVAAEYGAAAAPHDARFGGYDSGGAQVFKRSLAAGGSAPTTKRFRSVSSARPNSILQAGGPTTIDAIAPPYAVLHGDAEHRDRSSNTNRARIADRIQMEKATLQASLRQLYGAPAQSSPHLFAPRYSYENATTLPLGQVDVLQGQRRYRFGKVNVSERLVSAYEVTRTYMVATAIGRRYLEAFETGFGKPVTIHEGASQVSAGDGHPCCLEGGNHYLAQTRTIHWLPNYTVWTETGEFQPPCLILAHEIGHAVHDAENSLIDHYRLPDWTFNNKEEKSVITGLENSLAATHNHAIRDSHYAIAPFWTMHATSIEIHTAGVIKAFVAAGNIKLWNITFEIRRSLAASPSGEEDETFRQLFIKRREIAEDLRSDLDMMTVKLKSGSAQAPAITPAPAAKGKAAGPPKRQKTIAFRPARIVRPNRSIPPNVYQIDSKP